MASPLSFAPWSPIRGGFDPDKAKWELYNIDEDFSQANDLAKANPQKLRELQDLWWVEAAKYNVLPLDWRGVERLNAEAHGPAEPRRRRARRSRTIPGQIGAAQRRCAARCSTNRGRSPPTSKCPRRREGMIVTHGGLSGGYGLYLRDGQADVRLQLPRPRPPHVRGQGAAAQGQDEARRRLHLRRKPANSAKAATRHHVGQRQQGRRRAGCERTIPIQISLGEGLDIGMDIGSAVDFTYKLPFAFTGKIEKVEIDLAPTN